MKETKKIKMYHGTTVSRAKSILENDFLITSNVEDWLGTGIYFFINGISSGEECALEWALNTHSGDDCCVIEATIVVDNVHVFDLTTYLGLQQYNEIRKLVINNEYNDLLNRRDLKLKKRRDIRLDDQIITNKVMNKIKKKVLIHNVYIKDKGQRELILESSYPNSTVACVNDLCVITDMKIL